MANDQHPSSDEAQEAARKAAAADRLLPQEEAGLRSGLLEDAVHWMTVYEELFAFKQNLLATLVQQRDGVDRDGLDEVENDEIILTREAERLARRLEFWRQETANRRSG